MMLALIEVLELKEQNKSVKIVKSVNMVLVAVSLESSFQAGDALYYFGGKNVERLLPLSNFEDKGEQQGEEEG